MRTERRYTVGEVAALTHVTIRTLHHYDEVGLVTPSARSEAGYRLYGRADLERLRQVLFYRELGFSLEAIRTALDAPDHDLGRVLREQRALLAAEGERLRAMLVAVDAAIAAHERGVAMSDQEMFEVFGEFTPAEYDAEVRERWGETEAYRVSAEKSRQYGQAEWAEIKAETDAITQAFAAAMQSGAAPTSAEAMAIAEQHRRHITRWFYDCPPEMHRGLGLMFVEDERFTATWERVRPGLARYVSAAFVANADAAR